MAWECCRRLHRFLFLQHEQTKAQENMLLYSECFQSITGTPQTLLCFLWQYLPLAIFHPIVRHISNLPVPWPSGRLTLTKGDELVINSGYSLCVQGKFNFKGSAGTFSWMGVLFAQPFSGHSHHGDCGALYCLDRCSVLLTGFGFVSHTRSKFANLTAYQCFPLWLFGGDWTLTKTGHSLWNVLYRCCRGQTPSN